MRLVYYGTPDWAVPPLRRLVQDGRRPLLVVTRPDRPRGRGLRVTPSPVKQAALDLDLPVATPARAGSPEEIARVRELRPDLLVVVAYGQILPRALLDVPALGALNVHFSLLPRWRGASPVRAAILAGDAETGVSSMWMNDRLDEGPVSHALATAIAPDEDAATLGTRLAAMAATCLSETLDRVGRGELVRREQDPARATVAPKLRPEDARIPIGDPPEAIARRVRALAPEPGAWLEIGGERLLVLAASPMDDPAPGKPEGAGAPAGTVLAVDRARGLGIALPKGALWLTRVRPVGRSAMSGAEYANGRRLQAGARLPLGGVP